MRDSSPQTRHQPTARRAAESPVKIRVGSYYIRSHQAKDAVHALLPYVDVAGYQVVVGPNRQRIRDSFKSNSEWRFLLVGTQSDGFAVRTSRFDVLSAAEVVLANRRVVEAATSPYHLQSRAESVGSFVQLREKSTGRVMVVVSVHPDTGATHGGRPRKGTPRRVAMYRRVVSNTIRLAQAQARTGLTFVVGDWNIDYAKDARERTSGFPAQAFHATSFSSMWASRPPSHGTRGTLVLDDIWGQQPPTRSVVLDAFDYAKHKPVVATYLVS